MAEKIEGWVSRAETNIAAGVGVSLADLEELKALAGEPQQHLLYIWANADLITADVLSWNYFGPFDAEYQFDPRHACPYRNIKEAMADGWRIISFPAVEYPLENTHNQLGHEFILERFFPPGGGLPHTPHGARKQDTPRKQEPRDRDTVKGTDGE